MKQTYPGFPEKVKKMMQDGMDPDEIAIRLDVPPAQVRRVIGRRLKNMGLLGKTTITRAVAEAAVTVKRLEMDDLPHRPPNEELAAARKNLVELRGLARSYTRKPANKTTETPAEEGWLFSP